MLTTKFESLVILRYISIKKHYGKVKSTISDFFIRVNDQKSNIYSCLSFSFLTGCPGLYFVYTKEQWIEITSHVNPVVMRPYVIVNVAMSADGKISTHQRRQVRISGAQDFTRVDRLKAKSDAVMVGIGTVLADDPSLTIKSEECRKYRKEHGQDEHPVRIVVDSSARIDPDASVLNKGEGKRVIAVSKRADVTKVSDLKKKSTVIVTGDEHVDLTALMSELYSMGIHRIMVEGGGTLIAGLFEAGLVHEIFTFIGNIIIGGRDAPTCSDGEGFIKDASFPRLTLQEARRFDQGILLHWIVENP
jgi:2,5-diamino-6-(ribosylamino)-4(3H)-pyrimidinone 5'-phosphate reductase